MKQPSQSHYLWPGGWFRVFLVALAFLNLVVSYELWFTNPLLASVNVMMAVILLLVLAVSYLL